MTYQVINLGTAPTGAGGDTSRSANIKVNENFTNPQHAASRVVGVNNGNVMEVGAFGLGPLGGGFNVSSSDNTPINGFVSINSAGSMPMPSGFDRFTRGIGWGLGVESTTWQLLSKIGSQASTELYFRKNYGGLGWLKPVEILHTGNTTTDSNGFIKKASPVIHIFCDRIEPNEEAQEQNPTFEKLGTGHYLIKGTKGFATQGWWIEVPTDSNGNKVCAVEYQTLENGDLEIKTFKKKLNEDGDIVANLEKPMDIPCNSNGEQRWIDIRLNELPKKPIAMQVPRTEKQPKMVKRIKYAPQLTYITKMEVLIDDSGNVVKVKGRNFQNPVTHIHTDANGTPILTDQPVVSESGETVFEFVQAVNAEGNPVFEDVPVLDADGNQITDEVIHEP